MEPVSKETLLDVIESLYQICQRRELTDLDLLQADEAYGIAQKAVITQSGEPVSNADKLEYFNDEQLDEIVKQYRTPAVSKKDRELKMMILSLVCDVRNARGEIQSIQQERDKLIKFARKVIEPAFGGYSIDGGEVQDLAVQLGLLIEEPYDPDKHGEEHGDIFEPGDTFYRFSGILVGEERT